MEMQYLSLLKKVVNSGHHKEGRNGWVRSLYNQTFKIDCSEYFPLLTVKEMWFKGILEEFNWYLTGSTSTKKLKNSGVHIWDKWELTPNDVGHSYGFTLINWHKHNKPINQFLKVIQSINNEPNSRRHIISLWNPENNLNTVLPPCLPYFQFYVIDKTLHLTILQRSCDLAVGLPWDIATGALFLYTIALETELKRGSLHFNIVDAHLYDEHLNYFEEIKDRVPLDFPTLDLKTNHEIKVIFEKNPLNTKYSLWHNYIGELKGYKSLPKIPVTAIK